MFKDLYKKANDKIDTSDAKARVLENISNYSKPHKNFHTIQYAAAMAACAAVTFVGVNLFHENYGISDKLIDNPINTEIITQKIENIDNINNHIDNTNKIEKTDSAKSSEVVSSKNSTEKTAKSQKKESQVPSHKNETSTESLQQSLTQEVSQTTDVSNTVESTLAPVPAPQTIDEPTTAMSLDTEISVPSGGISRSAVKDISKKIVLPDNMERIDDKNYIFSGNGKYVIINCRNEISDTDFKNSDIYKTIYVNDYKADIYKTDNTFNVLFCADFNYTIYCENFTETELEQLIDSLI